MRDDLSEESQGIHAAVAEAVDDVVRGADVGAVGDRDRALSAAMQARWIAFARTGDPNGPGLAPWPAFAGSDPRVLRIGADAGAAPVPNLDKLRALDTYYAGRRGDSNMP